jgi:hypothetical protein
MKKSEILPQLKRSTASILVLTIASTLLFSLVIVGFAQPAGLGQLPSGAWVDKPSETWGYIYVRPLLVGVGQTVLVNGWVSPPPHRYADFNLTPPPGRGSTGGVERDYGVIVTDPDGNQEDFYPIKSDGPGSMWITYTPNQVGTWKFQIYFNGDEWFDPVTSDPFDVVVQQDPVTIGYPDPELPTDRPWDWPIPDEYRSWARISGYWLAEDSYNQSKANFNPYTRAPDTAHILWKVPPLEGQAGLIGGPHGTAPVWSDTAADIVTVMAGRGYSRQGPWITCFDVRTGEMLFQVEGEFYTGAIRNNVPCLYDLNNNDNRFRVYNGYTGEKTLDVPGLRVIGGRTATGWVDLPGDGEFALSIQDLEDDYRVVKWWTNGSTSNFENRICWNITWPFKGAYTTSVENAFTHDTLMLLTYPIYGESGAIDLNTGERLWGYNLTNPVWVTSRGVFATSYGLGYSPIHVQKMAAWNVRTGEVEWETPEMPYPWGNFWAYSHGGAYDLVYQNTYTGMYAFSRYDGSIVWNFTVYDEYNETPYGNYPFYGDMAIGDGKIYSATGEHSPTRPMLRGQRMYCNNAHNGDLIWSIMGYWGDRPIVAEDSLFANNEYDGYSYCFRKGETATTVSVQNDVYAKGESVLIKGTVLDLSPAQEGTGAISDASMTAWMEYLHMQQPMPMDATGVTVSINAIAPDGQYVHIGTTTSNTDGKYALLFTPDLEGSYEIVATFEGSGSYYPSHDTTYLGVGPAVSPDGPIEPEPTAEPEPGAPLISTEVAIVAAVAVVAVIGIVAYWALKKRK